MNNKKLAAVMKKHNIAKAVRTSSGYVLPANYGGQFEISYYSHFTARSAEGIARIAAALKAEGIAFKQVGFKVIVK